MSKTSIIVTDHAVLRWLERVEGVDVNAVRRQISRTVNRSYQEGANRVNSNGVAYCIEGSHVVTVIPQHLPNKLHVPASLRPLKDSSDADI